MHRFLDCGFSARLIGPCADENHRRLLADVWTRYTTIFLTQEEGFGLRSRATYDFADASSHTHPQHASPGGTADSGPRICASQSWSLLRQGWLALHGPEEHREKRECQSYEWSASVATDLPPACRQLSPRTTCARLCEAHRAEQHMRRYTQVLLSSSQHSQAMALWSICRSWCTTDPR